MMYQQSTMNARGQLIDLTSPIVMGVVNVTPDSFFDGGNFNTVETAIIQVSKMVDEGAHIIDIGGMSSRPGSEIITSALEVDRIGPVIEAIIDQLPEAVISVDTIHADTARLAMELGAHMINDISGGRYDEDMVSVAAEYGAPFICMHMQGLPKTMQVEPTYADVVYNVLRFFVERMSVFRNAGVKDVILDPGFGFGKTIAHNYDLLHKLGVFKFLELPILVGISRKSMINGVLDIPSKDALNGTTALHMLALQNGARILRVHDVREAIEVIRIHEYYQNTQEQSEYENP